VDEVEATAPGSRDDGHGGGLRAPCWRRRMAEWPSKIWAVAAAAAGSECQSSIPTAIPSTAWSCRHTARLLVWSGSTLLSNAWLRRRYRPEPG
jgi:hypothetical protein